MNTRQASYWRSRSFIWGIAWFLSYFGVRALFEHAGPEIAPWLKAVVLIPVVPAALFLFYFITGMKALDELERRIQLEALAFAYPLALILLMTLGLLDFVTDLNPDDWSYRHLWPFLVLFYVFGVTVAARRYR